MVITRLALKGEGGEKKGRSLKRALFCYYCLPGAVAAAVFQSSLIDEFDMRPSHNY
jgi:hypothetical protein